MKPIKNFESISKWVLRFAVVAYLICLYRDDVMSFNFKSLQYIVTLLYVLFALLLLFGGLSRNATLTVISGLVVALISVYKVYTVFYAYGFLSPAAYLFLMIFGIGLFFTSKGNS